MDAAGSHADNDGATFNNPVASGNSFSFILITPMDVALAYLLRMPSNSIDADNMGLAQTMSERRGRLKGGGLGGRVARTTKRRRRD
jgi:hypothetical protein